MNKRKTINHLPDYNQLLIKRLQASKKYALEYLKTSLEQNADCPHAFLLAIRQVSEAQGMGLEQIAKEADISTATIYKVLNQNGNPTLTTLTSILKVFGLRLTLSNIKGH